MTNEQMTDVLDELEIAPRQTVGLTGNQRSRLLNFLLRWEHLETLHVCLDVLIPVNPRLVSLLDLRARAFLAQGRPDDALTVMRERLRLKTSLTARALLARVHLARGDVEAAHQIARSLVEENEDSAMAWGLLGEVELARGDTDGALAAYRRLNELRPQSRAYLLGMAAFYRFLDDWVTASGYAVRLLRTADVESPLTVTYLRRLRDYFRASEEETRVADLEAELARRHGVELVEMRAALSPTARPRPAPAPTPPLSPPWGGKEEVAPLMGGKEEVAPPMEGKEGVAPPMGGKEEVAPPMEGKEGVAPPMGGKEEVAPLMGGKEEVAPPMGGKEEVAPPMGGKEEGASPLMGGKEGGKGAEPLPGFDQVPVSEEEREHILEAARRLFGFESLLPGQLETLACVLRGEDVLTILPTGGGKSLCYQLPALLAERACPATASTRGGEPACPERSRRAERGTTLVVSPLIALMKDQVDSLPAGLQRRATTINSSLERDALRRRLERGADGAYRLVYAAPERLCQPPFLHALRRAGVDRLVIDEAHCVSVWGHDFRPDYLTIGRARQALGNPPLLAMTATAPPRVRRDILHHLGDPSALRPGSGHGMRIIAGDVTRPNLQLEVFYARDADEKLRRLLAFCKTEPGSGIVYAGKRVRCEELAALLRGHGIVAGHYHAGVGDRAGVQDDFMAGRIRVVVATIAFGLGIDKPDIRFIVHFVPSNSLEAYYQEAGRAGRDGLPARCLLMYASSDQATLTRRARRDVLPVELLRAVYAVVKRRLGGDASGRVAAADLERDLQADETRVRVALSLLEEAGLLRRGPNFPRTAVVCQTVSDVPASATGMAAFCQAARLRPGQSLTLDLADVARRAGLPLDDVERRVLEWADAGWLRYRSAGRDWLLELLPPPTDAAERIGTLLERYETINVQRVDEIVAYARTWRCRHGHLNAYLGGRTIERCSACDNCLEIPPPPGAGLPGEREQLLAILRCVSDAPWSWGRVSLVRILRGGAGAHPGALPLHERARENAGFGALAFRSKGAVERLLDRLEGGGFLRARRLGHGGVVLDLTPAGKAALQDPTALGGLLSPAEEPSSPSPPPPRESTKKGEAGLDVDESLFQALRAWQIEQARAQKVPPHFVFHRSHLRTIAAHRPVTLEALSELKGVGPHKLEQYGAAVIELVREHLAGEAK